MAASTSREADIAAANRHLDSMRGEQMIQFRMGYGIHLDFGLDYEVTVETDLPIDDGAHSWRGQPLTAAAAGAWLPLILRTLTSADIDHDGTLRLAFDHASISIAPSERAEAWQVCGPGSLLIVSLPGGAVSVWT